MQFNTSKSYSIIFGTKNNHLPADYRISGEAVQSSDCLKYLGVPLKNNLHWDKHIRYVLSKASSILGLVRHTLYDAPTEIRKLAYFTLCCPILEYGCEVWDPHARSLITDLESLQNRTIRFIYNIKGRDTFISQVRSDKLISTLQHRRRDHRIQLFLSILEYEDFHPSLLNVINTMLPNAPITTRNTSFNATYCRTNIYLHSFLPRTARELRSGGELAEQ